MPLHLSKALAIGLILLGTAALPAEPLILPAPKAGLISHWTGGHFTPRELASKGNGAVRVQPRLIRALNAVREALGRPIRITSGYRDPAHNARVGGAPRSRHMAGDAVDIDLSPYDAHTRYLLVWHLIDQGFTSFGTYARSPNMLHADMRQRAAIWRHGGGRPPLWFRRAIADWDWRPVTGAPHR